MSHYGKHSYEGWVFILKVAVVVLAFELLYKWWNG